MLSASVLPRCGCVAEGPDALACVYQGRDHRTCDRPRPAGARRSAASRVAPTGIRDARKILDPSTSAASGAPRLVTLNNALLSAMHPGGPPDPSREPERFGF